VLGELVGSSRPLSTGINEGIKTALSEIQAASALFRHQRTRSPAAQPMLYRRADHPSRCRERQDTSRRVVFPRCEAGGTSRPAGPEGAVESVRLASTFAPRLLSLRTNAQRPIATPFLFLPPPPDVVQVDRHL